LVRYPVVEVTTDKMQVMCTSFNRYALNIIMWSFYPSIVVGGLEKVMFIIRNHRLSSRIACITDHLTVIGTIVPE